MGSIPIITKALFSNVNLFPFIFLRLSVPVPSLYPIRQHRGSYQDHSQEKIPSSANYYKGISYSTVEKQRLNEYKPAYFYHPSFSSVKRKLQRHKSSHIYRPQDYGKPDAEKINSSRFPKENIVQNPKERQCSYNRGEKTCIFQLDFPPPSRLTL